MPEFKTEKVYFNGKTFIVEGISEVSPTTLDGGIKEFQHRFTPNGALIYLIIPVGKVNGYISSAIAKAKNAGFDAEERNYVYGDYLEIYKKGYNKDDDQKVVEELRKVAIEVVSKDYSNHIKDLPLEKKTFIVTRMETKEEGLDEFMKKLKRTDEW